MALSNAERQARHRDRMKGALRNVSGVGGGRSLPTVIADWWRSECPNEDKTHDEVAAEAINALMKKLDIWDGSVPDALATLLGGSAYVAACDRWGMDVNEWGKSRKRDKGPMPEPPPAPVT